MNEDRIVGAGRNMLGGGERAVGEAVGSDRLQADGIVDQVTGAVQQGYGKARDAVAAFVDDAPGAIGDARGRGIELARRGDDALRRELGENAPLYLLAGAITLLAFSLFAVSRS